MKWSPGGVNRVFHRVRDFQPHAHGFEDLGRQLQGDLAQEFLARQPPLFVAQQVLGDFEPPDVGREPGHLPGRQHLQDLRLLVRLDAGEIVGLDGVDPNVTPGQVQFFHHPGLGLVEINRPGVALPQGPVAVNGAQGALLAGLEDGEALPDTPDVHFLLGEPGPGEPGVPRGGMEQVALPGQFRNHRLHAP